MKTKAITKYNVLLLIIIAVNLASIIYCFAVKKEGWHSDEVWSYGFANSFYKSQLYLDNDGKQTNLNEWVDSKVLNDYIEVSKGERFRFDSVYNNQIYDLSPPFHSMILHAICSVFPDTFSWWYSFAINIAAFVVCMIFLYKTAKVLKDEKLGILCCLLYGVSLAARDTYVYLRMYAMCTAMTMVLLYNACVYTMKENDGKFVNKNLVGIFVTSLLMFFTHYYMIPLVGIVTAGVCILFVCRKKIKKTLVYGGMQLLSLALSFALFPSVIKIFLSHQDSVDATVSAVRDYKLPAKLKVMANFILYKLYGIKISVFTDFIWLKATIFVIISLCIILLPLYILLRDTAFVRRGKSNANNLFNKIIIWYKKLNKIYVILVVTIVAQTLIVALTSQVYNMGWDEGRYIMYLYPIVTIFITSCVYSICAKIKTGKVCSIVLSILIALVVAINIYYRSIDNRYYYPKNVVGKNLASVVDGKSCVFLSNSQWAVVYMTPVLRFSREYFQVSKENYEKYENEFIEKNRNDVVVLIDVTDLNKKQDMKRYVENSDELVDEIEKKYKDMLDYYKKIYEADDIEKVSAENVFGRRIEAYVLE